jgi:hypothetical protein
MRTLLNLILAGEADRLVGQALWSYLSAVTHLTWYGIRSSIIPPFPTEKEALGVTLVGIGADSNFVDTLSICLTRMFATAASAHLRYMGWDSDGKWITVHDEATKWTNDAIRSRLTREIG